MDNETEQKIQSNALVRIADALEEVLRLVKVDQEDAKKRMLAAADEGLKEHQETDELSKEWKV